MRVETGVKVLCRLQRMLSGAFSGKVDKAGSPAAYLK